MHTWAGGRARWRPSSGISPSPPPSQPSCMSGCAGHARRDLPGSAAGAGGLRRIRRAGAVHADACVQGVLAVGLPASWRAADRCHRPRPLQGAVQAGWPEPAARYASGGVGAQSCCSAGQAINAGTAVQWAASARSAVAHCQAPCRQMPQAMAPAGGTLLGNGQILPPSPMQKATVIHAVMAALEQLFVPQVGAQCL